MENWKDNADIQTRAIVDYAQSLSSGDVGERETEATTRHVLDSMGCALGAIHSEPARIARSIAATASGNLSASVLGLAVPTTPEYAAFANGIMVRYLDYNDAGPASGHPSDGIAGILAVGDAVEASGRDVVRAIFTAYEICAALSRNGGGIPDLTAAGVDYSPWISVGVAVGAGMLLDLEPHELASAISLALVPSVPLRVVRTGELSAWKGGASPHGSMNAVFGARLAQAGVTAPLDPFTGADGFARLTGCDLGALDDIGDSIDGRSAIEATSLKLYPSIYTSQGLLDSVLELRAQIEHVDEIEGIEISLFESGWKAHHARKDSFDPANRETADHSHPYLVAAALTDGRLTPDSFTSSRVRDPALRPLMGKISVVHDPELTRAYRDGGAMTSEWPTGVAITLKNGQVLRKRSTYPKGSPNNPMTDDELVSKFQSCSADNISDQQSDQALDVLWRFADLATVRELTDLFGDIATP